MQVPINVKSPNISKWQLGFNSAFKELNVSFIFIFPPEAFGHAHISCHKKFEDPFYSSNIWDYFDIVLWELVMMVIKA
jgi:hypothetical protein